MTNPVVTSQPTPSAPLEEKETIFNGVVAEKMAPSAPPIESVVVTQPTLYTMDSEKLMQAQTEAMQPIQVDEEEAERRRQRNQDYCCYACADSYADDTWCWYIMFRMYCRCLGMCCEGCANCLDSCGEGCANCLHGCCENDQGGQDSGCCSGGDGNDGCCSGDSGDSGDAGCCADGDSGDCDCCDCDCGGCFD